MVLSKITNRYITQWAAQFYAAAELTRRGYIVSLTFGNAPATDLLVQSPNGKSFTVDVKGQSTKSFWLIQSREKDINHYFILIYLPKEFHQPVYFIVSSIDLMKRREEYAEISRKRGKYNDELGGINWKTSFDYENNWDCLPK